VERTFSTPLATPRIADEEIGSGCEQRRNHESSWTLLAEALEKRQVFVASALEKIQHEVNQHPAASHPGAVPGDARALAQVLRHPS